MILFVFSLSKIGLEKKKKKKKFFIFLKINMRDDSISASSDFIFDGLHNWHSIFPSFLIFCNILTRTLHERDVKIQWEIRTWMHWKQVDITTKKRTGRRGIQISLLLTRAILCGKDDFIIYHHTFHDRCWLFISKRLDSDIHPRRGWCLVGRRTTCPCDAPQLLLLWNAMWRSIRESIFVKSLIIECYICCPIGLMAKFFKYLKEPLSMISSRSSNDLITELHKIREFFDLAVRLMKWQCGERDAFFLN